MKYFLVAVLFIPFDGFSKKPQAKHLQLEGFSLKTDLLPMINNIISNGSKSGSLSGEIYFNEEFSFTVDLGIETENQKGLNRMEKRFGSHIRWYFMQEDCNCSAFFVGTYFSIVKANQTVDHRFLFNNVNTVVSYNRSSLEGGLIAGYQILLFEHFVIDPSVQLGMEF